MALLLSAKVVRARAAHKCDECGRPINPGTLYEKSAHVDGGMFFVSKYCRFCVVRTRMLYDILEYDEDFVRGDPTICAKEQLHNQGWSAFRADYRERFDNVWKKEATQ